MAKSKSKLDNKLWLERITKGDPPTGKEPKGYRTSVGRTSLQIGRDIVVGGLAGGLVGHLVGRPGALVGVIFNAVAYAADRPGLASFGTGMFAAGLFKPTASSTSGARMKDGSTDNGAFPKSKEQVQSRLKEAGQRIRHNLYLDSIPVIKGLFKKKEEGGKQDLPEDGGKDNGGTTSGNLTGFGLGDMEALDQIQSQLVDSAVNFQRERINRGAPLPDPGPIPEMADEEEEQMQAFVPSGPATQFAGMMGEEEEEMATAKTMVYDPVNDPDFDETLF